MAVPNAIASPMFMVPASNLNGLFHVDPESLADHLAAAERGHRLEVLALGVEGADAGRREHLVARARKSQSSARTSAPKCGTL